MLGFGAFAALVACHGITEVSVVGTVDAEFPVSGEDVDVLPDATVTIFDAAGEEYAHDVTNDAGFFRTRAPSGETIFAEIAADGWVTTSFTGTAGLQSKLSVPEGTFFGVPGDQMDEVRTLFDGCPAAGDGGGAVFGEVRVYGLEDPFNNDQAPLVTTAQVGAVSQGDVTYDACYLGADGVYDPDATVTGDYGAFAIFEVPPGLYTLTIAYAITESTTYVGYSTILVPEGDVSAVPRFPAWVDFPL